MSKKIINRLLAALVLFLLPSCGSNDEPDHEHNPSSPILTLYVNKGSWFRLDNSIALSIDHNSFRVSGINCSISRIGSVSSIDNITCNDIPDSEWGETAQIAEGEGYVILTENWGWGSYWQKTYTRVYVSNIYYDTSNDRPEEISEVLIQYQSSFKVVEE